MKISKLFHWLYFMVMMLPLFAIPVYAIYVRNENSTYTETVQVEENKVVNFNQLYDYTLVSTQTINGITFDNLNNGSYHIYGTSSDYADLIYPVVFDYSDNPVVVASYKNNDVTCRFSSLNGTYNSDLGRFVITETTQYYLRVEPNVTLDIVFYPQIFNLSEMFGVGNEPSNSDFISFYPDQYYEYTTGRIELLKNYQTVTFSDSDVGSQLVYTTYNTVNKYFNYDSVFNFGDLYDWLQLTFFNGNATLGFFIFWHCLIYWLLTSLLWLIFDVLMYVPMLVHRWLDKASLS